MNEAKNDIPESPPSLQTESHELQRKDFASDQDYGLHCLRHSCAHVLAQAVLELFPSSRLGVGPAVENGFYYDIETPQPLSDEDLAQIEERMRENIAADHAFVHENWSRQEAEDYFGQRGQTFKLEIMRDLGLEDCSIYKQGDFVDLCRGPHVQHTGQLPHFKLLKISGAYWRGDAHNAQMQRIYGTVWQTAEELQGHLERLEEAEKRDHRKIGQDMELFALFPFSPGSPVLLPNGLTVYKLLQDRMGRLLKAEGYQEVRGPVLCHQSLWETSGHWEKFKDDMFLIEQEGGAYGLKPMNCPVHMSIFKMKTKSYRDLPFRIHDESTLHRNELSGTLAGLARLRMFHQDDTHIFVAKEQVPAEIERLLDMVDRIYSAFDLEYSCKFSTRPDNFMGEQSLWDMAETTLQTLLEDKKIPYQIDRGGGAFYGPKIDIDVKDTLGRAWQLATTQVDFQMPQRFELKYAAADGSLQTPVVIHSAIYGAIERFMALLIENCAGQFPVWLAPEQTRVLPVSDRFQDYGEAVCRRLVDHGSRATLDTSYETLSAKIHKAHPYRIPYLLIVGGKEVANQTVSVRTRGSRKNEVVGVEQFIARLQEEDRRGFD